MNFKLKILIIFTLTFIASSFISFGFSDPSASYCVDMGYEYETITESDGSQTGICHINEGDSQIDCNSWDFYKGKCGEDYSYCVKNGYGVGTTKRDQGSYVKEYAVCIPRKSTQSKTRDLATKAVASEVINEIPLTELYTPSHSSERLNKKLLTKSLSSTESVDDISINVSTNSTSLDIAKRSTSYIISTKSTSNPEYTQAPIASSYPSSLDWRSNGGNWVSPIRNQGTCGSCWAFSSVAVAESRAKIDLNNAGYNIDLSEQDIISCNSGGGNCDVGGYETDAMNHMKNIGVVKESCFGYTATDNTCSNKCSNWQNEKMVITNFIQLPADANSIKQAIKDYGPVTVGMAKFNDFDSYSGGVYTSSIGGIYGLHSVAIVGYNDVGSYWICKNSWGSWGESGYFRIAYSENVLSYDSWLNDFDDIRTLFLDESYYITSTDISTVPTLNSASSSVSQTKQPTSAVSFSVYAKPNSIKQLSSVKLNGSSMSGTLSTGGTFTLSTPLSTFGCQNMERNCALAITAIDNSGKSSSTPISIFVDTKAPRVTLISPKTAQSTSSINFVFNVSDNTNNPSMNCSLYINGAYRTFMTATANTPSQQFSPITLADGSYTWFVNCTDPLRNMGGTSSQSFTSDINPPSLVFNTISSSQVNEGSTVKISTGWIYGINPVFSGSLYVNSILNATNSTPRNTGDKGNVSFLYTTTHSQAGNNLAFYVKVRDSANLYSTDSPVMNLYVKDITPPIVELIGPINNQLTNQVSQTYSFKVNDNVASKLANCSLYLEKKYNQSKSNIPVTGTSQTFTATIAPGDRKVAWNVTCRDVDGNIGSSKNSFQLDTTPPKITLQYPSNYSWRNTIAPKLSYKFTDALSANSSCALTINSITYTSTVNNNTLKEVQVTGLTSNIAYPWYVRCTDLAGNYNTSKTWIVRTDNTAPVSSITLNNTANSNGWIRLPTLVNITSTDTSGVGVKYTQWKNSSTGKWMNISNVFVLSKSLSDNMIYYRSGDNLLNIEPDKQKSFKYDPASPTITSVVSSSKLIAPGASFTIDVLATDSLSGLESTATTSLNGVSKNLAYSSGKYSGILTAPSTDGKYNITIIVIDKAGNNATNSALRITVNSTLPTISVNKANGSIVSNSSTVAITFGGLGNAWYNYTRGIKTSTTSSTAQVTISGSGIFKLWIWANNSIGTTNQNYSYIIDNIIPAISFSTPNANLTKVNGSIDIIAHASDANGIASVDLAIDGTNFAADTTSPYLFSLATTAYSDGLHNLKLTSTDNIGLTNSTTLAINITNNKVRIIVNVTGDTSSSAGTISSSSLTNTPAESVIDSVNGLNSTSIRITLVDTVPSNPSSSQLSTVIEKINITADTAVNSRVYVIVPKIILTNLGLAAPYTSIAFYADHGSGVVGPLTSAYVDTVTKEGIEYERFYFEVNDYSLFFWGVQGTTSSGGNGGGGGGGGGSGGGGSGAGGGGGGTANTSAYDKVEIFGKTRIEAGENVMMNISKEKIPFTQIAFVTNQTLVKVNLKVEAINYSTDFLIKDNSYAYLKVTAIRLTQGFSNPRISFKVANSWIAEGNYDPNSIKLYRYNEGRWDELDTEKLNSDSRYTYYVSTSPGFSYFAIAAGAKLAPIAKTSNSRQNETSSTSTAQVNVATTTTLAAEGNTVSYRSEILIGIGILFGIIILVLAYLFVIRKIKRKK